METFKNIFVDGEVLNNRKQLSTSCLISLQLAVDVDQWS